MFDSVLVVGAGAIGSLYAAKLSARTRVHVVARPAHVEAVTRNGLTVTGAESFVARVTASTSIEAVGPRTLLLLTTKVNDNRAAIEPLARQIADDTTILCIQNGFGGEAIVREILDNAGKRPTVLRAITQFGAIFREPGVVDYKVAGQTRVEHGAGSADIAALFTAAGLNAEISDSIEIDVWRKLIFNCVINPITAITATEVGGIADPRLDALKRLVIAECLAVAHAEGVIFGEDFIETIGRVFGASRNIASMRQDLIKGKATEIDYMNGAVVRLGGRHGIACPVNAALVAIVKAMENN